MSTKRFEISIGGFMWINRTKYEVEKLKYKQRISYLENLICQCEQHDYVEIGSEIVDEHSTIKHIFRCKEVWKIA